MLCDSSDTNDALGMYFKCILFMIIQDVFFFFFFFFFGLQDSRLFLSSKKAFRTPDEPEIRRNNGPVCMQ